MTTAMITSSVFFSVLNLLIAIANLSAARRNLINAENNSKLFAFNQQESEKLLEFANANTSHAALNAAYAKSNLELINSVRDTLSGISSKH